jgi:coatomer protein complex subunit alpha (xenin)
MADSSEDIGLGKSASPMLTKFESKSARVKGLSFHPSRSWILAALHNGEIQLWDYVMASLVCRFNDHEGPVRGINFHKSQPLFVSGGDDYLIKVWDYKLRRCLFTLQGHLDYIRTVEFHPDVPWIVSSSDDQTVRIWNWQSREGISVLTGHNHYCMSASFHPKEDMVVSASLDQTVRVWDTTGLKKKTVRGPSDLPSMSAGSGGSKLDSYAGPGAASSDAVVKFVLEGHERGVNWASFHPTQPLIVTGADDRQVRLWRMNENKAWQLGAMRGHTNNVSCVLFHPRFDFIISDSEDRTIRIWDMNKRVCLKTFRRENDRFWILAAHPTRSLLAAGHDNGLLVFKLERERPAYDCFKGAVYRVKDGFVRFANDRSGLQDTSLIATSKELHNLKDSSSIKNLLHPLSLHVNRMNPDSTDILICGPGAYCEWISFPPSGPSSDRKEPLSRVTPGLCAVFTARNRFAVLDESHQICIKNFSGETTKKFAPPQPNTDWMFPGGLGGRVILRAEDRVTLFDTQSQRVVHEVSASKIKSVHWTENASYVCLLSKRHVVICTRDLEHCCTVSESVRVKSAVWTSENVLVYATLKHVKYMLPSGDIGVLRSLDEPVYMIKADGDALLCVDRDGNLKSLQIDLTECRFKLALAQGKYKEVMEIIKSGNLCGEAVVGYLEDKGYPEVALRFVKDDATSFTLAVECGQLQVARDCAERLQDETAWKRLGTEALKLGDVKLAELCMQKTRDLARLSFLYVTTGNWENLNKMQVIAERHKDMDSRMHNAILRNDPAERVKVLEQVGQLALAYVCAKTFGLAADAERLAGRLTEAKVPLPSCDGYSTLPAPLPPLFGPEFLSSWPLTESVTTSSQAKMEAQQQQLLAREEQNGNNQPLMQTYVGEEGLESEEETITPAPSAVKATQVLDTTDAGEAWDDDGIDLGDEEEIAAPTIITSAAAPSLGGAPSATGQFAAVQRGQPLPARWVQTSTLAADHVAAGSFETAMRLLNRQIGVVNFAPLKRLFLQIRAASATSLPGPPLIDSINTYPLRKDSELPMPVVTLQTVTARLPQAYDFFAKAKFEESLGEFKQILQTVPLVVCSSTEEILELQQLMAFSRGTSSPFGYDWLRMHWEKMIKYAHASSRPT